MKNGQSEICVLGLIIGFAFGCLMGMGLKSTDWKRAAVEHHCAEFNQTSGDWQWK